jgi:hypothetical protein
LPASRAGFAAELDVVVVGDRLGADKAAFEVRVNFPGCLWGGAAMDGPRAAIPSARQ